MESTVALGVISIGVLSVVGLLGTSLSASREAQRDSILGTIASSIMADMRAVPFDALAKSDLSAQNTTSLLSPLPDNPEDSLLYFDALGRQVTAASPEAVYECVVKKTPDPVYKGVSGGTHNLVRVELHFTWPISASANRDQRPEHFKFYGSIARF